MADEEKILEAKQVKTVFVGDENLPTHYVNMVNVRSSLEEFFLTFGTAIPSEITDSKELADIDSIDAQPLFRCVISRSVMKQLAELIETLYENQSRQIEQLHASQRKDEENGDSDSGSF